MVRADAPHKSGARLATMTASTAATPAPAAYSAAS